MLGELPSAIASAHMQHATLASRPFCRCARSSLRSCWEGLLDTFPELCPPLLDK